MTFVELLVGLEKALAHCSAIELSDRISNSRFAVYKELINRMSSITGPESISALSADLRADIERRHSEYFLALTESLEFIKCLDFLKTSDLKTQRMKLRRMLQGPLLPVHEDANSNESRNTLFEVNFASKLAKVGLRPVLLDRPDISVDINGMSLLIECKRPLNSWAVKRQIGEARKDLRKALKHQPNGSRGIIALCLSRLATPSDHFVPYTDDVLALKSIGNWIEAEAEKVAASWEYGNDGIIGIVFYLLIPSFDTIRHSYMLAEQFNWHALTDERSTDHEVVKLIYTLVDSLSVRDGGI